MIRARYGTQYPIWLQFISFLVSWERFINNRKALHSQQKYLCTICDSIWYVLHKIA